MAEQAINDELTHFLAMTPTFPGHWGRGATEEEAIANCRQPYAAICSACQAATAMTACR